MGITQQAYSRIEKSTMIGSELLAKVAKALGVEVSLLVSVDEESLINNLTGNHTTNIQVVLNYVITTNEKCALPDLTELTRNIEELARRAMNNGMNDGVSGAQSL